MTNKFPPLSIMKKMAISLLSGIIVGSSFLFFREFLINTNRGNIWIVINNILFQDITVPEGLKAIGILYIIGQMFMQGLQLAIVPLVIVSLSLALCKMSNPEKLGRIAGKTIFCFLSFYVAGAIIAGGFAYFIKSMGWFSVNLPSADISSVAKMSSHNPLVTVVNAVPNNISAIFSTNTRILSVITIAVIIGISLNHLGEKGEPFKKVLESINEIIKIYMEFLINKISPVAIFSMITRTFATYGIEYIKPSITYIISTILIGIFLVFFMYPLGIWLTTKLNPFIFIKKIFKVGIFAAATNSSAVTLPLNKKTCIEELGCSDEITSFVLPTGMTINMNGTTVMHMMAVTFIATSAGIDIGVNHLILAAFLSICSAMGTPAIPVAGTTMVFAVLNGLGFTSELCMTGYALVLAMNYPPGMAVITLNVVGDAAANVIICSKENELDQNIYNS
ncbi:MAG: dicarboxylate/amino acid:cation symporter [Peptostreptococcaceae bacterium]